MLITWQSKKKCLAPEVLRNISSLLSSLKMNV